MSDVQDRLRNIEDTLQVMADQLRQLNGGVEVTAHQKRYVLRVPVREVGDQDVEVIHKAIRDWRDGVLPVLVMPEHWKLEEVRDGPVEVKQEEAEVLPMFVADEAIAGGMSCMVGPNGGLVRVPMDRGDESIGSAWVDIPAGSKVVEQDGFLVPVQEE